MALYSKIEWTEQTWNPTTGCSKVTPGCQNCYAEVMARRLKAMGHKRYQNGFKITLQPDRLSEPLRQKKPSVYFVNSMSDLFHEEVPDNYIKKILDVIKQSSWHTFQILTKRADRMVEFFQSYEVPNNAWLGVTVEDKTFGVPRIDKLKRINSNIRFLSIEPLLENIGELDLSGIHWVIVGGESGQKARPMKRDWVINIKQQCSEQEVAFFFKQWGRWGPDGKKRTKRDNGRLLLGRTWNEVPNRCRVGTAHCI
ncbi:MAG: DUF5131 family protein, partial [Fidelibacterota bacterium]